MPRNNPLGTRRNPKGFVTGPRVPRPKQQTRIYNKAVAQQDPSMFTNVGFGNTGMTGES